MARGRHATGHLELACLLANRTGAAPAVNTAVTAVGEGKKLTVCERVLYVCASSPAWRGGGGQVSVTVCVGMHWAVWRGRGAGKRGGSSSPAGLLLQIEVGTQLAASAAANTSLHTRNDASNVEAAAMSTAVSALDASRVLTWTGSGVEACGFANRCDRGLGHAATE